MEDPLGGQTPAGRARLVEQLDRMTEKGQVTAEEAGRIRSAADADAFDAAVLAVRVRHARARLDGAVERGDMSPQEADENLAALERGEHPKGLRSHLRRLEHRQR